MHPKQINEEENILNLILLCSFNVHENHLPKKKGVKTVLRIASLGHALHVWLNGEYLGKNYARMILKR